MVAVNPIRTEEDYEAALARVDDIFEAQPNTPEGDELDVLTDLIVAYEDKHYPIGPPSLIGAIEFCIEQRGLTQEPDTYDWQPAEGRGSALGQAKHHYADG